jgi:RNA-binding protein YhbY
VRFLTDKELAAEKTVNIGKKGLTSAAHWQIKRPVLVHRQERLRTKLVRI